MNINENDQKPIILVAEDDEDTRWLIVSGLKDEYEVLEADNGNDAIDIALEHLPDLVVTDIMMPGMTGMELCCRLKTEMLTSHIPVVMLTAKASVDSQIEGLETGADDYVTKPFLMELLSARIRNLLKMRRLFREKLGSHLIFAEEEQHLHNRADRKLWVRIGSILNENYQNPDYSPDDLAASLKMSPRTLQRKIKALSDRSPVAFILQYRLKIAAELLEKSSRSITDIAYFVGFSDSNYFTRQFKNEYGQPPSEFRADHSS